MKTPGSPGSGSISYQTFLHSLGVAGNIAVSPPPWAGTARTAARSRSVCCCTRTSVATISRDLCSSHRTTDWSPSATRFSSSSAGVAVSCISCSSRSWNVTAAIKRGRVCHAGWTSQAPVNRLLIARP